MEISSKLRIYSRDKFFIESLYKCLKPDNSITLPGLFIRDSVVENNGYYMYILEVNVNTEQRSFKTLRGTIDEVLTIIYTVFKTMFK